MIEAEQVERGGVEVVAIGRLSRGLLAERIAGAKGRPATNPPTRHPCGEGAGIVIAALLPALHERLPTELRGADHQRRFE